MRHVGLAAAVLSANVIWIPAAIAQAPAPAQDQLIYEQPLTPQGIRQVQQKLRELGAYTGEADGVWGAYSQAALKRFQQTHGLQVTGQLNQATVATLGLNPSTLMAQGPAQAEGMGSTRATAGADQTAYAEPLNRDVVRTIQGKLRQLGFYRGGVDGAWGAGTSSALERFQQSRGLEATGQLNPATVSALGLDPNDLEAGTRGTTAPRAGSGSSSYRR